jgi:multidrug resistance efflux pump
MSEPKTITEALEALSATRGQVDKLTAELAAATELLTEAQSAVAQKEELLNTVSGLSSQLQNAQAEIEALKVQAQASEARITDAVASIGVPPVAIAGEPVSAKSKAELWAEYHKLPIEERNAFYKAHRDAMRD